MKVVQRKLKTPFCNCARLHTCADVFQGVGWPLGCWRLYYFIRQVTTTAVTPPDKFLFSRIFAPGYQSFKTKSSGQFITHSVKNCSIFFNTVISHTNESERSPIYSSLQTKERQMFLFRFYSDLPRLSRREIIWVKKVRNCFDLSS